MTDFGNPANGSAWRQTRRIDLAAGWLQLALTAAWAGPTFWFWQHFGDPAVVPAGGPGPAIGAQHIGRALLLTVALLLMTGGAFGVMFADTVSRRACLATEAAAVVWGALQIGFRMWDTADMGLGVEAETPGWMRVPLSGWLNVVGGIAMLVLVSLAMRRAARHRALVAAMPR